MGIMELDMDQDEAVPTENLQALRDLLITAPTDRVVKTVELLNLNDLLRYLSSLDTDQINTACEVLEVCFSTLSIQQVAEKMIDKVLGLLHHKNENVRLLAINEVYRIVCNENSAYTLPEHMNIALEVVKCINDDDLKVSTKAMKIVSYGDWLLHIPITNELIVIMELKSTSSRCKCYDVIVDVVKKNPDYIDKDHIQELLFKLIKDLQIDDILLQLNILEILSNLSMVPHGLNFLINNNVLKSLSQLTEKVKGNPLADLLIPGLMKFFGSIAYLYPTEIYQNYPFVVEALFEAISTNSSILPTALDTLGFVGTPIEGKLSLAALGRVFTDALPSVGMYIKNSPTEIRIRAMNCLEQLIAIKDEEISVADQRITLMTREWFREISDRPASIEVIYDICKNPFPELRISALKVLFSACQHEWGQKLVQNTAGLIEFLLNRSVEHNKDSKHLKYEIITRLSKSSVFDEAVITSFKEYAKEGPFYVDGLMEVATEGD